MVITNLQQKQNRKIWVPIRGGNRGGWSLFDWQKVREMPYRDREMYLGNSAKIGVLDKGGKWRKKDWYLKRNHLEGDQLEEMRGQAMRKDQERMNTALGIDKKDQEEELTPAEMQILLKRIKGGKDQGLGVSTGVEGSAIGLGFDKTKVQIRAKPTAKMDNPHRLQGVGDEMVKTEPKQEQYDRPHKKKKEKKQKKRRDRSVSRDDSPPRKKFEEDLDDLHKKKKKHRHRSPSSSNEKRDRRRQASSSRERDSRRHKEDRLRDTQKRERSRGDKHGKRYRNDSD